ncbi:MAG: hypothetical protein AB8B61_05950 [Cyclobacteriaceae bacterium]
MKYIFVALITIFTFQLNAQRAKSYEIRSMKVIGFGEENQLSKFRELFKKRKEGLKICGKDKECRSKVYNSFSSSLDKEYGEGTFGKYKAKIKQYNHAYINAMKAIGLSEEEVLKFKTLRKQFKKDTRACEKDKECKKTARDTFINSLDAEFGKGTFEKHKEKRRQILKDLDEGK